jgi:2,4-dienoyl-CoA reductase-like NADH-dependent reductase (Old Yellow Enzyme family)/thioredoxin reductase
MVEFYRARARGGAALIVLDCPCLDYPRAYKGSHQLRIDSAEYVAGLKELLDSVKSEGAKVFMQLNYPRERAVKQQVPGAKQKGDMWIAPLASTMSVEQAHEILEIMAQGAVKARDIGYDGVEIQASYGDLISQLLSPLLNVRTDELGGSLENRSHFLIQLIRQVKGLTGRDFPVMVKLVCDEFVEGGLGIAEAGKIAVWAEKAGADAIVANAGNKQTKYRTIPPLDSPLAPLADLAARIKSVVNIPVVAIGKINRPEVAEDIISRGRADFVAMARALVADPDFARKVESGNAADVRPCVACLEDCAGQGVEGIGRCCTVNPFAGHEYDWPVSPARQKKSVLVIGAGPCGTQAALIASQRGHEVQLWEQSDQIGGQIRLAHIAPFKQEMAGILNHLNHCLNKSSVIVRLGQTAVDSEIAALRPDVVIVATGSRPLRPSIPGADSRFVVQARELYEGGPPAAKKVVIIGGGDLGCETADWLAAPDKQISVVEIAPHVLARMKQIPAERILARLKEKGVRIYQETQVIAIEDQKVRLKNKDDREFMLEVDLVVLAINAKTQDGLFHKLQGKVKEVFAAGDAASPGNLGAALRNATEIALKI